MEKGYLIIVDDEQQIADLVSVMAERAGYKSFKFDNGKDAIELYRSDYENVILVITDLSMKGITGLGVIEQVLEINPMESILIITGYIKDNIKHLVKSPNVEILQKPFTMSELKAKIQFMLMDKEIRTKKL